jgi:hypothetical protein
VNYLRIYNLFIADRRKREKAVIGYSERHHIKPRCLGGGDGPENLIRLTPEDHFFAHLLLAKAHGGKLWAPIAYMLGGHRKAWEPRLSRVKYGWASRRMGEYVSEAKIIQDEIALMHLDGRQWAGRQVDMPSLGISRSLANMLIKGRVKSAKGWYLAHLPRPDRGGKAHPMYRHELHAFVHEDGARLNATQHDFHLAIGAPKASVCRLIKGDVKTWRGWRIERTGGVVA